VRYGGRGVTLYAKGEAVAVSYGSSAGTRTTYLGKDVLGSVRAATADTGTVEGRYEYDAFGQPYSGDLSGVMNLGYTGKPYDAATGLYDYGHRDYKPQAARFTTADPVRDGNNWFAYVNNDPVNYVDLWGLECSVSDQRTVYFYEVREGIETFPARYHIYSTTVYQSTDREQIQGHYNVTNGKLGQAGYNNPSYVRGRDVATGGTYYFNGYTKEITIVTPIIETIQNTPPIPTVESFQRE